MANLLEGMGRAQPVTGFIDTALKYRGIQSEAARRDEMTNIMRNQAEAEAKQAERDNEWLDVTEVMNKAQEKGHGGAVSLAIKKQMELGLHKEVAGPDNTPRTFMRRRDISGGVELIGADMKLQPAILADRENFLTTQLDALEKKREDPKFAQQYEQMASERRMVRKKLYGLDEDKVDYVHTPEGGTTTIMRGGEPVGQIQGAPKKVDKWSEPYNMVIDGKTIQVQKNETTGQLKTVAQGQTTNVNVDVDMGLSKGARAKAEEDVQEATDMYKGLENLATIAKPEFFTYAGQLQAGAEKVGEKAGVVKDPKFLGEYSGWKAGTEQEFNKYRKWATGVAAGEKELERLANSFPNVNMSKTQYMAALKLTASNAWKLAERRRRALAAGIMDPGKQKDFYRLLPLDAMPDPPADVLRRFSPKSKFEIIGVE